MQCQGVYKIFFKSDEMLELYKLFIVAQQCNLCTRFCHHDEMLEYVQVFRHDDMLEYVQVVSS